MGIQITNHKRSWELANQTLTPPEYGTFSSTWAFKRHTRELSLLGSWYLANVYNWRMGIEHDWTSKALMFRNGFGAKLASPTKEWVVRCCKDIYWVSGQDFGKLRKARSGWSDGKLREMGHFTRLLGRCIGSKAAGWRKATHRPVFGVSKFFLLTQSTLVV